MRALVLDLFGTLVTAPTPEERAHAASRVATVVGCAPETVENYFRDTWRVRHDGTLPTLADLAAHLVRAVHRPGAAIGPVADELRTLGQARLVPAPSVVYALKSLRSKQLRLGILSDASAEIVAAWPTSPLAALVHTAVFSCTTGAVKPDQRLYRRICAELDVSPDRALYVGDGGGDELPGALAAGMAAVAVRRRGPTHALAFGDTDWSGPVLDAVEHVPAYLAERA
ncbi:HAD family hydrolase [Amycolatopsis rhizosphaerae]|uniref:HAD family hydrolase n=1 Tax=Amycolatopsis rhizosphaerae TaxID=2053003 RepID=A0A558D2V6_9PSEU|nr:HAD family hydrolase [Amycolatopsis rhizosphaerae]TVT55326.1 HAD family hydrolase [Amycolatopsis rhizosphaerae]